MSDVLNPEKLQKPLKDKNGPIYPLTTYDQIIMPDGVSRWDGKSAGGLSATKDGKIMDGNNEVAINAATLNGMTFEQLKEAIMSEAVYQ